MNGDVPGPDRVIPNRSDTLGDARRTVDLFGLTIDALSMDETVARIDWLIAQGGVHQQVSVNVDKVVKSRTDPRLGDIINTSDVVNADGQPIVWASRLLGRPLPERVTGVDLMQRLIAHAAVTGLRVYFLGARAEIVDLVLERVRRDHPAAVVAGGRDGYWAPDEEPDVAHSVAAAGPDILFLAIPSPAKERFLDRWKDTIGARFVMGVGGSFDVYAGAIPRAPRPVQRLGMEWLYRLVQEPRRMWRRYLVEDMQFLPIVASEWLHSRRTRGVAARAVPGDQVAVPEARKPGAGDQAPRPARALRILVVSNLYPSPTSPAFGTFIAARVEALRRAGATVDVAAIQDSDVHHRVAVKYGRLAVDAVRFGIGRAMRRRRYDIVEAHIAFPTGWLAWPVAVLHRAPLVLFVHGADVADISRRSRLHAFAARTLFRRAGLVVVNSPYMADRLAEVVRLPPERVVVQSPGIDVQRLVGEPATESRSARSGLLFVGRLNRDKGVDELLAAVRELRASGRDVTLTMIGDGPERERLAGMAASFDSVIDLRGAQPPDAVAAAMRACDVLVMPSAYAEPLGLVAIEGMAAGAIVVATRTGGLGGTVVEGETGVTCEPGDVRGLTGAIERALAISDDPAAREALVGRARAAAREHDLEVIADASIAGYRRLIASRR